MPSHRSTPATKSVNANATTAPPYPSDGLPSRAARAGAVGTAHTLASSKPSRTLKGVRPLIEQLVDQIEARYAQAQEDMADPDVIGDRGRLAEAGRAYRDLEPAARLAEGGRGAPCGVRGRAAGRAGGGGRPPDDAAGAEELLEGGADAPEVREMLEPARR